MVDTVPYSTGVPGRQIWASTTWASTLAFCWASSPARVTGAVAPAMASGDMASGCPYSAQINSPSNWAWIICMGLPTEQMAKKVGRRRRASLPPAAMAIMRIMSSVGR